jgi:hypothetical protein
MRGHWKVDVSGTRRPISCEARAAVNAIILPTVSARLQGWWGWWLMLPYLYQVNVGVLATARRSNSKPPPLLARTCCRMIPGFPSIVLETTLAGEGQGNQHPQLSSETPNQSRMVHRDIPLSRLAQEM